MKRRIKSKISIILVASMLLSMSLPVLAYAASYLKIVYDASSGRIHGVIYSKESSVSLSVYENGRTLDIGSEALGVAKPYLKDNGYVYEVDGVIGSGLNLEKLTVTDPKAFGIHASVTDSVYAFEHAEIAENPYGFGVAYYHTVDEEKSTVTAEHHIMISKYESPAFAGFNIYKNGEFLEYNQSGRLTLKNLPILSKYTLSFEKVNKMGQVSPSRSEYIIWTPSILNTENIGFHGKPNGYALQSGDSIVTFAPKLNTDDNLGKPESTTLRLSVLAVGKTAFDGHYSAQHYKILKDQLTADDFTLVEVGNPQSVIPISEVTVTGDYYSSMTFKVPQLLTSDKTYTLKMSSTSSGKEIRLPDAHTNRGIISLELSDSISTSNIFNSDKLIIGQYSPPAKPSNLSFAVRDRGVDVSWDANTESDLQGYLVYLDGRLLTSTPITTTKYSIVGLTNGVKYHVNVAAVDQAGTRSLQAYGYPTPTQIPDAAPIVTGSTGVFIPPVSDVTPGARAIDIKDLKAENGKVPVKLAKDDKEINFPANVDVFKEDSILELSNDDFSLEIPGVLISQLQKLVSAEDLKDAQISISFDKLSDESAQAAITNASNMRKNTKLKSAGDIYEFTLKITTMDGKEQKLTVFGSPIKLKLKIADGANAQLLGVYFIGDNGELEYVGGQINNGFITVDVNHFSKYGVLEYSKTFDDVSAEHWAYSAITSMVAKHVVTGVSETSFAPSKQVTRAEFVAMLARQLKLQAKGSNPFADVNSSKWYANDVIATVEAGIVKGRSASKFAPDELLTRQEMTVMLMKAYEMISGKPMEQDVPSSFVDQDKVGSWAIASVNAANKLGFIKGRENGNFAPHGNTTRAEAIQVISKLQ